MRTFQYNQKQSRVVFVASILLLAFSATAHAADGDFVWAGALGGTGNEEGYSISVDAAGNVYTTGYFEGTADFDPGPGTFNLTSAGSDDIFVSKLDGDGNFVWARALGGTGEDQGWGIAVDSAGNIYLTGFFNDTADFDPGASAFNLISTGSAEIFVSKLDVNGNFIWAKSMGGTSGDESRAIATDDSGNVYTTGYFSGTADFDPGAGTFDLISAGFHDIFVSKLDTSGDLIWARSLGGTNWDEGRGIKVDDIGNVYTTGWFMGTADFDPGLGVVNLLTNGFNDIFVSKLDSTGNFVWAKAMGGASGDFGYGIALDILNNVYTTGYFEGTVDFDPGTGTFNLTSAGVADIFVSKLDASGDLVWAGAMGGTGWDEGHDISVDSLGNICTLGEFSDTADFHPGVFALNLTSTAGSDIFVSKLSTNGDFVWAKSMGGAYADHGYGITVDAASSVYATGYFLGTVDFDPGSGNFALTGTGGTAEVFVQKLSGPPDTTPPNAITITPATTGPTNADDISFTVTFDEDVINFANPTDLVVTHNGTASGGFIFSGGPLVYTVTITGVIGDGNFTIAVNTGSDVQDLAGNPLASSVTSAAVLIDNTPPTATLSSVAGDPINGPITVTVTLSEASTDFAAGDIFAVNGSVSGFSGSGTSYSFILTPLADGTLSAEVGVGTFSDAAGNTNTAASNVLSRTADLTAPVFTAITAVPNSAQSGQTVTITFTASEALQGNPVVTVNGNAASFSDVTGLNWEFSYTVQAGDPLGAALIEVQGVDLAGNPGLSTDSTALTIVDVPSVPVAAWPMLLALGAAGAILLRRRK